MNTGKIGSFNINEGEINWWRSNRNTYDHNDSWQYVTVRVRKLYVATPRFKILCKKMTLKDSGGNLSFDKRIQNNKPNRENRQKISTDVMQRTYDHKESSGST